MDAKARAYACPRCTVGRCALQTTTFVDVYHGQLLSIPNTRAFICDVCHFVEFEQEMLDALWDELYGDVARDDVQTAVAHKRSSTYGEG
ncbi:MAG: hypothetical protein OXG78_09560 [Chloroflexi bacterium]|nr:hypothetical protein [Chloroflexota bacterium]